MIEVGQVKRLMLSKPDRYTDELLDTHRLMVEAQSGISSALSISSKQHSESIARQKSFTEKVGMMQAKVIKDLQEHQLTQRNVLERVFNQVQDSLSALLKQIAEQYQTCTS